MTASTDWQLMSPLLKKMNLKINRMQKKEKKEKEGKCNKQEIKWYQIILPNQSKEI